MHEMSSSSRNYPCGELDRNSEPLILRPKENFYIDYLFIRKNSFNLGEKPKKIYYVKLVFRGETRQTLSTLPAHLPRRVISLLPEQPCSHYQHL